MAVAPALSAFKGIKVNTTTNAANAISIPVSSIYPVSPVSGYTVLTPFNCALDLTEGYSQNDITNFYSVIWWFGDGTYSTDYSPTHIYQWPGTYEIKVGLFNFNTSFLAVSSTSAVEIENLIVQIGTDTTNIYNIQTNGVQPITFSGLVTAYNYITDSLTWNYTAWPDLSGDQATLSGRTWHGFQSSQSGTSAGPIPLAFDFITNIKDRESIVFNLYSENSLSQPWIEVESSQFTNLRPRWRFTTASATSLSAEAILSNYAPLTCTEVRVLSTGVVSSTGILVGLSGTAYFYYVDDIPSQVIGLNNLGVPSASAQRTTLWVTLKTFDVKDLQTIQYAIENSYANSTVVLSSYYYVESLRPHHLELTLDGILPLPSTYWPTTESRFVVTINSPVLTGTQEYLSNKKLLNYPLNTFNVNNGNYFSIVLGSSSTLILPQLSATFNTSSAVPTISNYLGYPIARYDSVGRDTGGYYIGTFTPYSLSGNTLSAVCLSAFTGNILPTSATPSVSAMYFIADFSPASGTGFNPLYINTSGWVLSAVALTGKSVDFTLTNFNNEFFTRKFAGNFDYGSLLKIYALQPTINQNTVLFDNYFASIAGTSATNEDTYGGVIYERIANYVANNSDINTSNLNLFYSLAQSLGEQIDNFDYKAPGSLQRIIDLYTASQSQVWGARSLFAKNFSNSTNHTNLGVALTAYNINTAIVTAGEKIVINDLFNTDYYELLEVPTITSWSSITARSLSGYFYTGSNPLSSYTSTFPLTTYPLSAFFGWGLKTPIENYYKVYYYVDTIDNNQKEGLVNWNDPYTTLSETTSSYINWIKDGGTLEKIYNYYIHKGLGFTQ